jgi:hypothetical protein
MIYQRPFSQRVKDIGHWQVMKILFKINKKKSFTLKKIMEYMIFAAIIVNCIFCSIRGVFRRMLPDLPFAAEIFLLVCIEVSTSFFFISNVKIFLDLFFSIFWYYFVK